MKTRLREWRNSLAARVPQILARQLGLEPDSLVEMTANDDGLPRLPVNRGAVTLDAILDGITTDNRHDAVDTGPPMGRETW